MTKKLIAAISEASGSIYGVTLIKGLPAQGVQDIVDFVVARILAQLNIKHNLAGEWSDENLV